MDEWIPGLHHVTAICGDPQRNVDFYTDVLGLRLVKRTVNFDAPDTYHFYYGDERGTPGTIMTFFPWPRARHGHRGTGQVVATAFAIPAEAVGFWADRLKARGVSARAPVARFDEEVIAFEDPDGLGLELVASPQSDGREAAGRAGVPGARAVRGFFGVTLAVDGYEKTADLLSGLLGFGAIAVSGSRFRYRCRAGGPASVVDVLCLPDAPPGRVAVGTVHHVAWRASDDESQARWRRDLAGRGFNVTPQLDRNYFRSIYFREPGGVLFEVATDAPGFATDEPLDSLGSSLRLPAWLEPHRREIEASLPAITVSS